MFRALYHRPPPLWSPPASSVGEGQFPHRLTLTHVCDVTFSPQSDCDKWHSSVVLVDTWEPIPTPSLSCVLSIRDLLQLGGELARTSRAVQEAGLGLSAGLRLAESRAEAAQEKQALLQAQLEEQLRDKVLQEEGLAQLQMQSDLDKADLSARWVPGRYHVRQGRRGSGHWGRSFSLCEAPRVAEWKPETQGALAQGTSQVVQPL